MINFSRQEIIDLTYTVSLEDFMKEWYAEAHTDFKGLRIYVKSGLGDGYITYVFTVRFIKGLDENNPNDVNKMIKAHFKSENIKKDNFKL